VSAEERTAASAAGNGAAGNSAGNTPANYESYSDVDAAMAIINPDGSASLYNPGS
jgi:hypothetical protein